MDIEISCPEHGELETLELPDSYDEFSGRVKCGRTGDDRADLRIQIEKGRLTGLWLQADLAEKGLA